MFLKLAEGGIAVYGFDQRGWGRSVTTKSQRGNSGPTAMVIGDLATFIQEQLPSEVPLFVMGYSMGGCSVLTLASMPEYEELVSNVRGWILESPHIAFAPELKPSWLIESTGRLGAHFLPHYQITAGASPADLTRNIDAARHAVEDPFIHGTATLESLTAFLGRIKNLETRQVKLSTKVRSLVIMHGTMDKACSYAGSKEWFQEQHIEDGEFKTYEGWYHALHAEPDRDCFHADVRDWILARLGRNI